MLILGLVLITWLRGAQPGDQPGKRGEGTYREAPSRVSEISTVGERPSARKAQPGSVEDVPPFSYGEVQLSFRQSRGSPGWKWDRCLGRLPAAGIPDEMSNCVRHAAHTIARRAALLI